MTKSPVDFVPLALPWPPVELSPNARGHWSKKARAARKYRADCFYLALAYFGAYGWPRDLMNQAGVSFEIVFRPPDRRNRDDDNLVAAFKSGRDGIAQAVGIDDAKFKTTFSVAEPTKGGAVLVRMYAAA